MSFKIKQVSVRFLNVTFSVVKFTINYLKFQIRICLSAFYHDKKHVQIGIIFKSATKFCYLVSNLPHRLFLGFDICLKGNTLMVIK